MVRDEINRKTMQRYMISSNIDSFIYSNSRTGKTPAHFAIFRRQEFARNGLNGVVTKPNALWQREDLPNNMGPTALVFFIKGFI